MGRAERQGIFFSEEFDGVTAPIFTEEGGQRLFSQAEDSAGFFWIKGCRRFKNAGFDHLPHRGGIAHMQRETQGEDRQRGAEDKPMHGIAFGALWRRWGFIILLHAHRAIHHAFRSIRRDLGAGMRLWKIARS